MITARSSLSLSPGQWPLDFRNIPPRSRHQSTQTVRVAVPPTIAARVQMRSLAVATVRRDAAVPVAAVLDQVRIVVAQSVIGQSSVAPVHLLHGHGAVAGGHEDVVC